MSSEVDASKDSVTASPKGLTMPGTSQGSAHPETHSTTYISTTAGVSSETNGADLPLPQPFTAGEWEAIVAAAVANVAAIEAAQDQHDPADAAVYDLLETQPAALAPRSRCLSPQVPMLVSRPGTAADTG